LAILGVSFRLLSARAFLPRFRLGKQAALILALLVLAGCGSSAAPPTPQSVTGDGYRFAAPAGWRVTHAGRTTSAENGKQLVSVTVFPLGRPFRPALWDKAVVELDKVAAQLATQLGGRISSRGGSTLAAHRARTYDIAFVAGGKAVVERIAFILVGRREYQLLCRFVGDDSACTEFRTSFTLG
jgi:hypothetical protein